MSFSPRTCPVGDALQSIWGHHDICPLLRSFHATSITQSELSSLSSLKAWGNPEKFKSEVTFLLSLTRGCTEGDNVFGLSAIWVHPYQARAPTIGEAVKLLTPLPSTGSDCPYALVQFNEDACHAPLPKEGQLSIQVAGSTGSATCRRVSQLQVCQLLSSGSQVVYPAGLNGCEVPLITSPPEPMAKGINLLCSKAIYLKVDILQSNMEGPELKALPLGGHPPSISIASPVRPSAPKAEGEVSMTMEVRELLSWVGLGTSEHTSGSSSPKGQELVVLVTPLSTKPEDFPKASGHVIPSEGPWQCWDGGCLPGGNSHSLFPHSQSSRAQQWCPPRCGSSLGRGQQGSRGPASSQVFPQCLLVEVSFGVWHGSLWEQFWGYGVYQGGKGCLCPFYPGSWGLLFCIHQGGRSLEGLPGYFHSAVTPQNCSAPWRGEKESTQLPLCLPGSPVGQPSRILQHAGSFLPCFAGTCTNISSL